MRKFLLSDDAYVLLTAAAKQKYTSRVSILEFSIRDYVKKEGMTV
jgi:hypothetical protein